MGYKMTNDLQSDHLARFFKSLADAEVALQDYLADQPETGASIFPNASPPPTIDDMMRYLRERAEQAHYEGTAVPLEGLSLVEIQHLFHELQVHQVELKIQNDELRHTQLELETSRDRFSSLYDFAPVGYCTIDRKGTILETNYTLCSMLGVPAGKLLKSKIQHYIQATDQDRFYLYLYSAIKGRANQTCEVGLHKLGGETFLAQLESHAAPDQAEHLWLVVSNISRLKRAEEIAERYEGEAAARSAQETERNHYRDLFNSDPDGFFITDSEGIILDVNTAGAALLKSSRDQLIGASLSKFLIAEDQAAFQVQLDCLALGPLSPAGGPLDEKETQLCPRAGEAPTVTISAALLDERPDDRASIRWLIRDQTQRKQSEAALKSEAKFRSLFEEAMVGISLFDIYGNPIINNRAMQDIVGYGEEELLTVNLSQLTHPADREQDEKWVYRLLSGEIDRYIIEKRVLHKNRAVIWVHQAVFWVEGAESQSSFIAALTENITEHKQMEKDMVEVRRRLIDAREEERLLLSQDLNEGPMQVLYGVSYKVKAISLGKDLTGKERQVLTESYEIINKVIANLREFAGEMRPPALMTFGIEKAIRSDMAKFRIEHPRIKTYLNLADDEQMLPERVRLTLYRIYQVAISNILRHSNASRVQVSLRLDLGRIRLEIKDNGRGFTLPQSLVELARSGHLGLVSAAERAEAIGGKLTILTQPGKGTTILVDIPPV